MTKQEEKRLQEYENQVTTLKWQYRIAMQKLADLPQQIPEKQLKKQEAEIRAMLEERMDDLSTSFRNRISKLTSELIADMQEGGSNRI